jgi:Ca2+-binding EF-hand superfamily protein
MKKPFVLLCSAALISTAALAHANDENASRDKQGTFASLDKDSDGRLTQDELASTPLSGSFSELDGNSDGYVSKGEFRRNTRSKPADR